MSFNFNLKQSNVAGPAPVPGPKHPAKPKAAKMDRFALVMKGLKKSVAGGGGK